MLARRSFLTGLGSAFAAPAIVRAASLMPVKAIADLDVYGRSPAMDALEALRAIDRATNEALRRALQDLGTFGTATVLITDEGVLHLSPVTSPLLFSPA